jgi:glutamate racemase
MSNDAPIGIFDSGLGGLSVTANIRRLMPHENLLFWGDSAYAPYGTKTPDQIRERCFNIADHLLNEGVKAIVIACNTATSVCAHELRERYPIPIIGMEPALKLACDRGHGKSQRIIVAATNLTLREQKFASLMNRFQSNNTIWKQPCPDLVTIVESGHLGHQQEVNQALERYFASYDLQTIDSIVLGCTHFVFYRNYFRTFCPPQVAIIDGNEGTANRLHELLLQNHELSERSELGQLEISNSDDSTSINRLSWDLLQSMS